ncbi:MAG: PD40 domain-containing protein, partial [Microcoleus sp. Co-bin12]|nr:PD40 domain-containing protein [Microcoleus sp. Co-bin12]
MTITPVSVDSAGNLGNSFSDTPSISADGRFVAFSSGASNIVPGDTNNTFDIFVRDRLTNTTTLVSFDSAGNQRNSESYTPSISADGRFVAFSSDASNTVPDDSIGIQ